MTYESFNPENKKNVAKAMALIFDDKNGIPYKLQCILGERLLWAATEYDDNGDWDKYFGPHYWSKGAIDKAVENIKELNIKIEHDLRHEHSIPKKVLNDELDRMHDNKELTEKNILNFLMTHAFAVIVSKEEDSVLNKAGLRSKMPRGITIKHDHPVDIFSRYKEKEVELAIYKLDKGMLASLKSGKVPTCGEEGLFSNRIC